MSRKIAISGASGLVGSRLAAHLHRRGDTVYRLVRRKPVTNASEIYWNFETAEIDSAQLEGMDAVVHLAGEPADQRWTPAVKKAIYSSRIDGTAFISNTLARLEKPPSVLISASATDYYADSETPIGEAQGRPGEGFMAEMCRDWEAATEPARLAGIRVVAIRIPSVLAATGHSILAAFLPLFKYGLGPILGSGKQLMAFIACDDMIRAIEHIMTCEEIAGPVNVLAPQLVTNAQFAKTLGGILHRPVFVHLPRFVLRLAMGDVAEAILAGDTHLRPDKLLATGFRFDFPDVESAIRHELTAVPPSAIDPVLALVERSCNAPANRFGPDFLSEHLLVVERFAQQLAVKLHADSNVVRVASLLHDIAAIQDAALIPVHAERGAALVIELCTGAGELRTLRIEGSEMARIATCVREHSSPKRVGETIPESVCLSNADAMSQIARPFYWFQYARAFKGLSHPEAVQWYRSLVEHNWEMLIDEARDIVGPDYTMIATFLQHESEALSAT